jgi:hypothetical protein
MKSVCVLVVENKRKINNYGIKFKWVREKLIDEVNSFKDVNHGLGEHPPSEKTIENTIKVVGELTDGDLLNVTDPSTTPYGTIVLDFETEKSELLSLEIGVKTMGYFIEVNGQDVVFRDNLHLISEKDYNTSIKTLKKDIELWV